MKSFQPLLLAAIAVCTSAHAGNSGKQTIASVPDNAAMPIAPQDQTLHERHDEVQGSAALGATEAAAQPTPPPTVGNGPEIITQAEQDAETLYSQPVRDPWEGFNRKMHGFNNVVDRFVIRPVAIGYDKIAPDPVQAGVSRIFGNLRLPTTALNQLLQGRPSEAGQSLGRFVVNSTAGIGGVFDPARRIGMPKPDGEDLGQTLATWGWRNSRYLVMPIMGPRTVRDAFGGFGDQQLSVINQIENSSVADKLQIMQLVDVRAQLLPMDKMRQDATDDYAFVRDTWAQRRNHQIEQDLRSNRVD
ncbi:VacJ family lipoprotein [Xanthomonas arboricola pv. juglandis]|uniref:MlaA family lipoprotein n=1 Tax=Xanthomonas arboricola TaxID=56448 RepID=UPI0003636E6B|nr:MlaA family lipoprotein [Xanthomonas arboricola]MDN0221535.1 MlaA family lipoprotein [Xanthomonas arboricola pv. juglandis]MDN0225809.1 MlaA family lipoprotein [Xanthomonas arboricola pv. juglandis]MDN0230043.1 MlaA family lipoprotein [Xanthomonas arboricola pv. juglandis]MDN0234291.1 MlaA family lipoprotein [Xanthomonas arboricola pv. juglandis]MDN0238588.1 MlaA family lipoprotein [Xanthomonas arboricola pv. juglandis]